MHGILGDVPVRLPQFETDRAIAQALAELQNVLAELTAAFYAIRLTAPATALTLVYDYVAIGHWLQGTWTAQDSRLRTLISETLLLANEKGLHLHFHHQPAHRSTFAGRHDYAELNARADALATAAVHDTAPPPPVREP